jgi:vacuolar-type H+-ATPase subunit H
MVFYSCQTFPSHNGKQEHRKSYRKKLLLKIKKRVAILIRQIVDTIKDTETKAQLIRDAAKEDSNEIIRQAVKKASAIRESVVDERRGLILSKTGEAEENASRKAKTIAKEAVEEAAAVERNALKNMDEAVTAVFGRMAANGNQSS